MFKCPWAQSLVSSTKRNNVFLLHKVSLHTDWYKSRNQHTALAVFCMWLMKMNVNVVRPQLYPGAQADRRRSPRPLPTSSPECLLKQSERSGCPQEVPCSYHPVGAKSHTSRPSILISARENPLIDCHQGQVTGSEEQKRFSNVDSFLTSSLPCYPAIH